MSGDTCNCCDSTLEQTTDTAGDRWLGDTDVLAATLPDDLTRSLSRLVDDQVETLEEFVATARAATGGGPLGVEDLCHTAGETPHRATVDGEPYHFACFYDGIALASLLDEPAVIRTESSAGTPIELEADPDGTVEVTPAGAVMSFGVATDPAPARAADTSPDEAVVAAMCPYVRALPTRERYTGWAAGVDAATVGMPLGPGVAIATALTADD